MVGDLHLAGLMYKQATDYFAVFVGQAAKLGAPPQQSPVLSQAGMTFPHNAGGAAAQQALMSPMAQQGAPLIMNPPLGATGIHPYAAVMQQGKCCVFTDTFVLMHVYFIIYYLCCVILII